MSGLLRLDGVATANVDVTGDDCEARHQDAKTFQDQHGTEMELCSPDSARCLATIKFPNTSMVYTTIFSISYRLSSLYANCRCFRHVLPKNQLIVGWNLASLKFVG